MRSTKQRIERKVKVLTQVEKRRFHVPEKAKVDANVVGGELSAECCAKFKTPRTENGQTPDNTEEIYVRLATGDQITR